MLRVGQVALLVLTLLLRLTSAAADEAGWKVGRGTFYGIGKWPIHSGACGFGYISEDQPAGWDVAALSDQFPGFAGSCGRCYEIRCNPATVKDGYGASFDRTHACIDPSTSLLVRVADACPCSYPNNWYSNKRWCCGDVDHMDISVWAFEKLADKKWGVIGIQYRPVPCNKLPDNPAPPISNPTPGQYWRNKQPDFMQTGDLSTPKVWSKQQGPTVVQGWNFGDPTGSSSRSQSISQSSSSSSSGGGGTASAAASSPVTSSASGSSSGSSSSGASASFSSSPSSTSASSSSSSVSSAASAASASFGASVIAATAPASPPPAPPSPPPPFPSPILLPPFVPMPAFPAASRSTTATSSAAAVMSRLRESLSTGSATAISGFGVQGFGGSPDGRPAAAPERSGVVFAEQLQNGWQDASYQANVNWDSGRFGTAGGNAVCAELYSGGAVALRHDRGAMLGFDVLEWWVQTDGGTPQLAINLGAGSKFCSPVTLASLKPVSTSGTWSRFSVHLGDFGGRYTGFDGCGGNSLSDLTMLEFKNTRPRYTTQLCLDGIRLLSLGSAADSN